jgi:hypothetical protein
MYTSVNTWHFLPSGFLLHYTGGSVGGSMKYAGMIGLVGPDAGTRNVVLLAPGLDHEENTLEF